MRTAPVLVALAVIWITESAAAVPFVRCSAASYTTGGLAPGEGEGVWVPSDFQVAFNCAAMGDEPPDPAPVYALFNTLFGFESKVPLPPGRFEIDTDRPRPLYRFVPAEPDAFEQWWRAPSQTPAANGSAVPEPGTALLIALGLAVLGAPAFRVARRGPDAG